ncbi:kinase-like domain-containing protein [Aspergillus transmontanensis]|uniref:Kinase-like domain-containing protein n=1 Tax=Aspergillus transmontanensis TaxID=1034304 RepID=A0A5N6WFH8_9EURO|nr:kinase-like domain-containing protein [Aspergillus transmontanensis]
MKHSTKTTASTANLIPLVASIASNHLHQFRQSDFVKLDSKKKIEEEEVPLYNPQNFYPVYIGEVIASRYQVVSKLGYGTSSTVWLCRDLQSNGFVTLKVCARGQRPKHEISVSKHLENSNSHPGKSLVRLVLDSFEITGPYGKHVCLTYQPLGMSFTEFRNSLPNNKFSKDLTQRSTQLVLIALAFLHDNHVIHTDISSNNILQGNMDSKILSQVEEDELNRPSPRKALDDRYIYYSRSMPVCASLPVVSDLGEARIGKQKHRGDIMPGIYRAPEVILDMDWDCKVDIWSIGAMVWDLVQDSHLFFAKRNDRLDDEQHLAEMVSLMGPPPPEFLRRSQKCRQFWDEQGNWKGSISLPEQSLEIRERRFFRGDKELFLNFLRRILCWLPEERPTAGELAYDDFLMQPIISDA